MDRSARWGEKALFVMAALVVLVAAGASGQTAGRITGRERIALEKWTEVLLDCLDDPWEGFSRLERDYKDQLAIQGSVSDEQVYILTALRVAEYTEAERQTLFSQIESMIASKKDVDAYTEKIEALSQKIAKSKPPKADRAKTEASQRRDMFGAWDFFRQPSRPRQRTEEQTTDSQELARMRRDLAFANDRYYGFCEQLTRQAAAMLIDVGQHTGKQVLERYRKTEKMSLKLHLLEIASAIAERVPGLEDFLDFFINEATGENPAVRFMALSGLRNFPRYDRARDTLLDALEKAIATGDTITKGAVVSSLSAFSGSREVAQALLEILKSPKNREGVELGIIEVLEKHTGETFDWSAPAVSEASYKNEMSRFIQAVEGHLLR